MLSSRCFPKEESTRLLSTSASYVFCTATSSVEPSSVSAPTWIAWHYSTADGSWRHLGEQRQRGEHMRATVPSLLAPRAHREHQLCMVPCTMVSPGACSPRCKPVLPESWIPTTRHRTLSAYQFTSPLPYSNPISLGCALANGTQFMRKRNTPRTRSRVHPKRTFVCCRFPMPGPTARGREYVLLRT